LGLFGDTVTLNDLCQPPWYGIFFHFAAIMAKCDCMSQFVLAVEQEKTIAKSKQNKTTLI
jgi:hypothetical protein